MKFWRKVCTYNTAVVSPEAFEGSNISTAQVVCREVRRSSGEICSLARTLKNFSEYIVSESASNS